MSRPVIKEVANAAISIILVIGLVHAFLFGLSEAYGQDQPRILKIGASQRPSSLGNPFTAVGPPSSLPWSAIFDALTMIGEQGDLVGALATEWASTDPYTWEFKLRPDVTFHNGRPFTAQSVVRVIEFLMSDEGARFLVANEVRGIESVNVKDSLTVEFRTTEIDAILPKRLSLIMMIEPDHWSSLGPDGFATEPVGTGPFTLESWGQTDATIRLSSFESSWRSTQNIDQVHILNLPDSTARLQALLAGQVDAMIGLSPDDLPIVESGPYRIYSRSEPIVMSIAFITERAEDSPLKDKRVRQALNLAVDREQIAEIILAGLAEPAYQGAAKGTFGFNPQLPAYQLDLPKARALLTDAGYPDGFDLKIDVLTNLSPNDTLLYQKMAQDLARIGVNVELNGVLFSNYLRKYSSSDWQDTDAFSLTWNNAPFNDVIRPTEYFSCLKAKPFFCEPDVVGLIERSHRTIDPVEREKVVQEIMSVYRDIAPALWLVTFTNLTAYSNRIATFHTRYMGVEFERITFH